MKRLGLVFIALIILTSTAFADHIRGGELSYKFVSSRPGFTTYEVSLKLYIDCFQNRQGQYDASNPFTVFRKRDNAMVLNKTAPITSETRIEYDPNSNPCLTNPPRDICYRLRYYKTTIELADDPDGYVISFQRCCRIAGINNVFNSDFVGATYSSQIPGTKILPAGEHNSSPVISGNDAVAICEGTYFTFDFSATDPDDGDRLEYRLCEAYEGGGRDGSQTGDGNCYTCPKPDPAAPPPYKSLSYTPGYAGGSPLGGSASIDPNTGIISGIAPSVVGQYVVTVCVMEYRRGALINTHRKDIHLKVSDCKPLNAILDPDYDFCDDFKVNFQNKQVNPAGSLYIWDYGDGSKRDSSTAALGMVQHTYIDTGTYKVKLRVELSGGQCLDSTSTQAKVYPGFNPGFYTIGSCLVNPFQFTDSSKARYGRVNKWIWDFGDETTLVDISTQQNPTYKYNSLGVKTVKLTAFTDKGCEKSFTANVEVRDRPMLQLSPKDTLMCILDSIQLNATAPGSVNPKFSWSPSGNIINPTTSSPIVFPKSDAMYKVIIDDNGCLNSDSVRVHVVDHVTLFTSPDTTICLTDNAFLEAAGDGLKYTWSPPATVSTPDTKITLATPIGTTTYTVTANIGRCTASRDVTVKTVPYPGAFAGQDVIICYEDTTQLNGTYNGKAYSWSPSFTLINPKALTPLAFPLKTTQYILTVTDDKGCPKPGRDTVVVTVRPKIRAFAGNDTAIVLGQPLQLRASGADIYSWDPPTGLNFTNISNPVANISQNQTYTVRVSTPEDCFAFDTINIKVFKTNPDIFVPNAFTPGGSANNVFRPIPVGIASFEFFRVFNRWGQMVFSTTIANKGWDGNINGNPQGTGTYVWMVKGIDISGKTIFKKGTVVLIR